MAAYYCVVNCYQYFLLILYGYAFQLLMCLFVFAYPSSYQRLFAVRCYHRSRSLMYGYDYRNYLCLHYACVKAFPRQQQLSSSTPDVCCNIWLNIIMRSIRTVIAYSYIMRMISRRCCIVIRSMVICCIKISGISAIIIPANSNRVCMRTCAVCCCCMRMSRKFSDRIKRKD